jgi:thiol-disulfide isomerase/thioredoxin
MTITITETINRNLNFYTTTGCHLCEQALQVVARVQASTHPDLRITEIDIADDDELIERYGVRIPVVQSPANEKDLGWPFDDEALRQYLDVNP